MIIDDYRADEREENEAAANRLADACAREVERTDRILTVVWNVVLTAIIAALSGCVVIAYAHCRYNRQHERERIREACPSGTAQRVIDEVNREPLVAFCNRVADFVFGTTTVTGN